MFVSCQDGSSRPDASHRLQRCTVVHGQQGNAMNCLWGFFVLFWGRSIIRDCWVGVWFKKSGVCFQEAQYKHSVKSYSLESMTGLLLIGAKGLWLIIIFMRLQWQSGSDLDFSLNVLMRALELREIKGDTVREIWGRDITRICHRPLG